MIELQKISNKEALTFTDLKPEKPRIKNIKQRPVKKNICIYIYIVLNRTITMCK